MTLGFLAGINLMSAVSPAAVQVTATSGDPRIIAAIAASVEEIDRDTRRYTVTTHKLEGYSTEGGELRAFLAGTAVRRMTVQSYGKSGRAEEDFYFSGDQLVFVRELTELYDRPLSGRVRVRIEHALYFNAGQLIRQIRTQTPALPAENFGAWDPNISQLLVIAKEFVTCAQATNRESTCVAPARNR
jgi:hypothetical protein